jgi:hypothetical protein
MFKKFKIAVLLLLISARFCYSQAKHFYGSVLDVTHHQDYVTTSRPAQSVKIYAQEHSCQGANRLLVYASDNAYFDFELLPSLADSFKYLLFETPESYTSAPIKYIETDDSIKIYAGYKRKQIQPKEILIQEPILTIDTNLKLKLSANILVDGIIVRDTSRIHLPISKPAIYLYPKKEMDVQVQLTFTGKLLTTYPPYLNGWNVIASPDGKLFNKSDRRKYNYLFWDGTYTFDRSHFKFTEGFNVKNEDYISFLESKLKQIGLNETEINDFIVYWLPEMNKYKFCQVRFNINDDIYRTAQINTTPNFDSQIRVFMEFKGFNSDITEATPLMAQSIPTINRIGFTLVEWGGSIIESDIIK